MNDLISRQVVLKDLEEYIVNAETAISVHPDDIYNYNSGLLTAIQVITDTPFVQPERKKGKWIITDTDIINRVWHCNCTECGEDPIHFISGTEDWWLNKLPKFCPNCGADMRKEKER